MRLHDRLTRVAGTWPDEPDLTDSAPRDWWLRTEDVGCLDKDGSLLIVGEIGYPAETENAPYRRGTVMETNVAGEGNQRSGQLVHALAAPGSGEQLDLVEIMAFHPDHRVGCIHQRRSGSATCLR